MTVCVCVCARARACMHVCTHSCITFVCHLIVQEELQQEKDRNTELVAASKQLSSLKKVTTRMLCMYTHIPVCTVYKYNCRLCTIM